MAPRFTVCALFYGNYPELARRLLSSLNRPVWFPDVTFRFGLNDVCDETRDLVHDFVRQACQHTQLSIVVGRPPHTKYPIMRRMLHEVEPLVTPYTMWFDDDSWIDQKAPDAWFSGVAKALADATMVGFPYTISLRGAQTQYVAAQPWYRGNPIRCRVRFATGGWWAIRSAVLIKHQWPTPDLNHRGGDVMLGVLCDQNRYAIQPFTSFIHVNADDSGKCSTAARRGFNETPIGVHWRKQGESHNGNIRHLEVPGSEADADSATEAHIGLGVVRADDTAGSGEPDAHGAGLGPGALG